MSEEQAEEQVSDDDWAAAMGEQAATEEVATAAPAAAAAVFEQFSGGTEKAAPQGFDMILDIPVALTVELGRTKISIRNLLQLAHFLN